jgi:hypothetical protein
MQSVIKPLNEKVKVLTKNVSQVLRGLQRGDPETKKQIKSLCTSVQHIKSDFKSTVNAMYASYESSVATMSGLYNPMPMVKIVMYYLQEALAAVELLNNLMKLAASLINISTLISLIVADLEMARAWLNKKLLWLTKALNRIKEKMQKNVEWFKRDVMARATLLYLKSQKKTTETAITNLERQVKATEQNTEKIPDVNGEYIDGTWYFYGTTESKKKDDVLASFQTQLTQINLEIEKVTFEKDQAIPNDRKWWNAKWDKEKATDQSDLIKDMPKINADVS